MFLECFMTIYDLDLFQNRFELDSLLLVLRFEFFLSIFVKMTGIKDIKDINIQGIKDSTDSFLLAGNFPLSFTRCCFTFFLTYSLWFPKIRTFTYNLAKLFIFDKSINL